MWLFFALLTPVFFAVVHVVDSYCVDEIFDKPWQALIIGSIASLVVFLPLPFFASFLSYQPISISILVISLLAGALIQISQGFYFQALSYSESGIVAAYWNMVPILVNVLSFFIFREVLGFNVYIAIFALICCSVIFCLIDSNKEKRWLSLGLMLVASVMQAIMFLLEEIVFNAMPYFQGFYLITTGLIVTGLLPLLKRGVRKEIIQNSPKIIKGYKIFIGIEIVNLAALASSQRAVDLGIPSLVASVETTIPAYTFMLSLILLKIAPKFGDKKAKKHLATKMLLVGIMALAIWVIS